MNINFYINVPHPALIWGQRPGAKSPVGAKRPGVKGPGGKTSRGGNGFGGKRPGTTTVHHPNHESMLVQQGAGSGIYIHSL